MLGVVPPNALAKKIAAIYRRAGYSVEDKGKIDQKGERESYWLLMIYEPGRIVGHAHIYMNRDVEVTGFSRGGAAKNKRELEAVLLSSTPP